MRVLTIAVMVLLSGCLGSGAPTPPAWDDAMFGQGTARGGEDAQSPPREGAITVVRQGDHWRASQEVIVEGSTGAHARIDVDARAFNGEITYGVGANYRFQFDIWGRGPDEASARAALSQVGLSFQHEVHDDVLHIGAQAVRDGRFARDHGGGAALDILVPEGVATLIRADTSNGDVRVTDHRGPAALLDTSNGDVRYSGETDLLWADTSNGEIELVGAVIDAEVDTSNAEIIATLSAIRTGRHTFDTSNGEIVLDYSGGAYDVHADTSNADVSIVVPGGEPVGRQDDDQGHVRSAGFSSAEIQVTVLADTSNAEIVVTG